MNYNRNSIKKSIKGSIKNSIKTNIKTYMKEFNKENRNKNMNIYKIKNYTSFNKYINSIYKNGKNEKIFLKPYKNNLCKTSQKNKIK